MSAVLVYCKWTLNQDDDDDDDVVIVVDLTTVMQLDLIKTESTESIRCHYDLRCYNTLLQFMIQTSALAYAGNTSYQLPIYRNNNTKCTAIQLCLLRESFLQTAARRLT